EQGAHKLAECLAFATFPRLKVSLRERGQRVSGPTALVEERAQLDGEIVAMRDEPGMTPQLAQTPRRGNVESFPKLIALVEQACVVGLRSESAIISDAGGRGLLKNVEAADAQISPGDGVVRLQPHGAAPEGDGLAVTPAII